MLLLYTVMNNSYITIIKERRTVRAESSYRYIRMHIPIILELAYRSTGICRLDTPTSGNVIVRDKELSKMNDEQLTIFRRRNIGFIFQNYNLVPILNVYENIVLPVELDGDTVDQKFLDEIVHLLGLEDKLKNMPNNLSGGQQQRVAIARALITKPAIVLADEPTGNLDSKTSAEVLGLIKRTSAEFRQTVVMITHNDDIARLADRIVRIEDGKIVE